MEDLPLDIVKQFTYKVCKICNPLPLPNAGPGLTSDAGLNVVVEPKIKTYHS